MFGCITNNLQTSAGASNDHISCTDTGLNVYTKVHEWTYSAGAAADGVTASIWIADCTTGLAITTDTVSFGFSASVTTKVSFGATATVAAGKTWGLTGVTQGTAVAALTGPSTTISGLPSLSRQWIALDGIETFGTDTYTQDAAYTGTLQRGTTGGAADTNLAFRMGFNPQVSTTDTHQASSSAAADWLSLMVALDEVTPTTPRIYGMPAVVGQAVKQAAFG